VVIAQERPVTSRRRRNGRLDRGAAAVEMALVLPILLFVLMGMIDFGRAYNAQIQLSAAAREGVRLASLNTTGVETGTVTGNPYGNAAIADRVQSAAGGLGSFSATKVTTVPTSCPSPNSVCVMYCPVPPAAGDQATVVLTANFTWITGISAMSKFFGSGTFPMPSTIQATGVMQCTG
jgi:Flp pilus assembly protein TadG